PAIAMALDAAERAGKPYEGAVALGCVIRGETLHFEIVSQESARALIDLSVRRGVPVGNGIITVDTEAQAWARARPEEGDKGGDPAGGAIALALTKRRLARGYPPWPANPCRRTSARPTAAAPPGSPPCRRSTRWISPAPG